MNYFDQYDQLQAFTLARPQPINVYPQSLHMKLSDLPIINCSVDCDLTVRELTKIFEQNQGWIGVIIVREGQLIGMLSRHACFEMLGKPFGIEIFSKMTILDFYNSNLPHNLILEASTSVQEAVKLALDRENSSIFEPIVVHFENNSFGLLNMYVLLKNQCDLLEGLYSEVHQLSIIDPLTNLKNRRGFFEAAQVDFDVSLIDQTDLSVLMIDIDNFKHTNDVYGHFVGDQVLTAVAKELQGALRESDLLGRYGGEEFIALLPGTPLETACVVADRLRKKVGMRVVHVGKHKTSVTISVGICHIEGEKISFDTFLMRADQAMYAAKAAGRDQIFVWNQKSNDPDENFQHYLKGDCNNEGEVDPAQVYDETVNGWVKTLQLRDKEMEDHAQRVVDMTLTFAKRYGIQGSALEDIRRGALLHDIGKITLPDSILFKPGPLTDVEWGEMHKHPTIAYELLSPISYLKNSLDIPYCHHEHWDGSGYPRGLKGEEIPLAARIFTIVDVWDALCSKRCYRPPWQPEKVIEYLTEQSGKMFDPNLTTIFIALLEEQFVIPDQGKKLTDSAI